MSRVSNSAKVAMSTQPLNVLWPPIFYYFGRQGMLSVTNYTEEVSTPDTYFLFLKSTAFMNVTFYLLVFPLTLLSIAYYFAILYSILSIL